MKPILPGVVIGVLGRGQVGRAFVNGGLLAVAILANTRPDLRARLHAFREQQASKVQQDILES